MKIDFEMKNYKCYKNFRFLINDLNLISGTNNSGKSSLLQAIYLLTLNKTHNKKYVYLDTTKGLDLGGFTNILNKEVSNREELSFMLTINETGNELDWIYIEIFYTQASKISIKPFQEIEVNPILREIKIEYSLKEEIKELNIKIDDTKEEIVYLYTGTEDNGKGYLDGIIPSSYLYNQNNEKVFCSKDLDLIKEILKYFCSENIKYIKAFRLYDFKETGGMIDNHLGLSGEYTAEYIYNNLESENISFSNKKFKENFDFWIKKLFGSNLEIRVERKYSNRRYSYETIVEDINRNIEFSLEQVGFGISQLLPLVTIILSSKKNDILVIENPEVHLHPKLQSLFTELLIEAAKNKIKLIIETHSEHVINKIRVNIKQNRIKEKKYSILFLKKENSVVKKQEIEISNNGSIINWPEEFFDQSYNDLKELIE